MDPESSAYNFAFAARIRSALDLGLLSAVLQGVTDHHPALRTTFEVGPAGLRQRVHPGTETLLELIDASGWSVAELECQVAAASKRPFDLEHGPVFRASLFTRSPGEQVLLLTFHHIVFDGWSLGVFLRHIAALHSAGRMGRQAVLPPPKASYGNFVRWQSSLLDGPEGKRLWQYWREQVAGDLPVLDLPTDHPRPEILIHRGGSYEFLICEQLWRDLKALAIAEGATPFMVLLAGFQMLLHGYSSQTDFLVGIYTSGRTRSEFKDVIGYFVNPVVLRTDLSGDPIFKAYLQQVHRRVIDALTHADFPFPLLVNRLQQRRDPSRSPLFQAAFNLLKLDTLGVAEGSTEARHAGSRIDLGGLELEPLPLPQAEGQIDLDMTLVDAGHSLPGSLKYNTDLFEAPTIARLAGHFDKLLAAIVAEPGRRVTELLLSIHGLPVRPKAGGRNRAANIRSADREEFEL
jgi:hypothetical protein